MTTMTTINSFADLLPLLPLLVITGAAVLLMLCISLWRNHTAAMLLCLGGLLLTALTAASMLDEAAQQVTPLIIVDRFNLLFTILLCLAAAAVAVFSHAYLRDLDDSREEYYLLLLIATLGAVVMAGSNHFVSVILGLETFGMCIYGLLAYPLHGQASKAGSGKDAKPLEAAVKYLVLSAAASAFVLFGMALLYAQTGTLAFTDLTAAVRPAAETLTVLGLLLITAGVAFKLSLAPFHIWTPDVYEGAPLPVTAYLATAGKAALFVILLRFVETSGAFRFDAMLPVYSFIAVLSIFIGNLLALLQENLKRLLAYSSIAHMGYLLIALIAAYNVAGTLNVEAVAFYLLAYTVMTLAAFGLLTALSSSGEEIDTIGDFQGLFWRQPLLAAVFTGILLSLAGIPLTIGFIGKFYLFFAGVEGRLWWLLTALVIGSGIGLYYYLRIVYRMILPIAREGQDGAQLAALKIHSKASYVVLLLLFIALLWWGVYPAPLMELLATVSASVG